MKGPVPGSGDRRGALPVLRTTGGPIPDGGDPLDNGARRPAWPGGDPTGSPSRQRNPVGPRCSVAGPTPVPTSPGSPDIAGPISGPFRASRTVGQDKR
jgi:hypothetical protein